MSMLKKSKMYKERKIKEKEMLLGENALFLIIHNVISLIFFYMLLYSTGYLFMNLVSNNLLTTFENLVMIIFISFISGLLGKGLAILLMYFGFEKVFAKMLGKNKNVNSINAISSTMLGMIGIIIIFQEITIMFYLLFFSIALIYILVNKIRSNAISFIVATCISSIFWTFGAMTIIQDTFFAQQTIWTMLFAYFIIKIGGYILTKLLIR